MRRAILPDVVLILDEAERERRCVIGDDNCALDDTHFYLCGDLVVPPSVGVETAVLGVWVELDDKSIYKRSLALWGHERRADEPPIACTLANQLPGVPGSLGWPARLLLGPRRTRPVVDVVWKK